MSIRCADCGYDLTGHAAIKCPECGERWTPTLPDVASRRPWLSWILGVALTLYMGCRLLVAIRHWNVLHPQAPSNEHAVWVYFSAAALAVAFAGGGLAFALLWRIRFQTEQRFMIAALTVFVVDAIGQALATLAVRL